MRYNYEIVNCCGDHMRYVTRDVPDGIEPDFYMYQCNILAEEGYPHAECGSCYDNMYRVQYIGEGDE